MESPDQIKKRIRVSFVLRSDEIPTWIARIMRRVNDSPSSEIAYIYVQSVDRPATKSETRSTLFSSVSNFRSDGSSVLFEVLNWVFLRFCQSKAEIEDAYSPESIQSLFPDSPVDYLTNRISGGRYQLSIDPERSQADNNQFKCDLLVNFGEHRVNPSIASGSRYGVWTLEHSDSIPSGSTSLPGFWESIEEFPTTSCVVRAYETNDQLPLVLSTIWSSTVTSSVEDNRRSIALHAVPLIPRLIDLLHKEGGQTFFSKARARNIHPVIYSARPLSRLSRATLVTLIFRRLNRRFSKFIESIFWRNQWSIFILRNGSSDIALGDFKRTTPPRDRFWADPYLLMSGDKTFVFFEEMVRNSGIGRIAVGEVSADNTVINVRIALATAHHLSHPFVIEHGGEIYMIPESRATKRITLYKNVSMPDRWEKVCDLMTDVDASDVTLQFHNGFWWLFVNIADTPGASTSVELFLFFSPVFPSNSWEPHPLNPVVSDVRRARSAGKLFSSNARLYRPSQDCSLIYGWRFSINHVEQLDTKHYKEYPVALAEPKWAADIVRTHTFNQVGEIQVVDGMVRRPRWWKAEEAATKLLR